MTDTLYSKVAKLAQTNPELRVHLVPLLRAHKTADTSLTGMTIEGPFLRFHTYRSAYRVTDLANAGKRGKTVDTFSLYDIDMIRDPEMQKLVEQFGFRLKGMKYDEALKYAKMLVARAEEKNLSSPQLQVGSERGIDVMPGGFDTIKLKTRFVELEASYDSFRVQNRTDTNNLPTCIPAIRGGKASIPVFYRWVKDNEARIPNLEYYEILSAMQTLGIKYHDYCALD